jgi:hypothetical protein
MKEIFKLLYYLCWKYTEIYSTSDWETLGKETLLLFNDLLNVYIFIRVLLLIELIFYFCLFDIS